MKKRLKKKTTENEEGDKTRGTLKRSDETESRTCRLLATESQRQALTGFQSESSDEGSSRKDIGLDNYKKTQSRTETRYNLRFLQTRIGFS